MAIEQKNPVFLIGYSKSGTTFLRSYFDQHPEIEFLRTANYFSHAQNDNPYTFSPAPGKITIDVFESLALGIIRDDNEKWQRERFNPACPLKESGVRIDPLKIVHNIHEEFPNAKVMLLMRNQISWLKSHYKYFFTGLKENQNSFEDFLLTPRGKAAVAGGCYDICIHECYRLFGKENVLVMTMENLRGQEQKTLDELCRFIGVKEGIPLDHSGAKRNESMKDDDLYVHKVSENISYLNFVKPILKKTGLAPMARKLVATQTPDLITEENEKMLRAFYAPSNVRTMELTNIDLDVIGYPL